MIIKLETKRNVELHLPAYMRVFWIGEDLMQFAREVGGSPLPGGELLQRKVGVIAIGVINATLRWRLGRAIADLLVVKKLKQERRFRCLRVVAAPKNLLIGSIVLVHGAAIIVYFAGNCNFSRCKKRKG